MHPLLEAALTDGDGLITAREYPTLASAINRARRAGRLMRVLSGTYLATEVSHSLPHLVRALHAHDPDAVVTGPAAARLTWWPELPAPTVDAYRRSRCARADGFRWHRYSPDPELVRAGLATISLQVLDLLPTVGPRAVDEALRRRATSLEALRRALERTQDRPGNGLRRQILRDSRDEPWSPAEREFHRVLRAARIIGWSTNVRVRLDTATFFLDVALPELKLAFEVDGFEFHSSRAAFERDRARDALLAARGWQVVRISAAQVGDCEPHVRAVVDARATLLKPQWPAHAPKAAPGAH